MRDKVEYRDCPVCLGGTHIKYGLNPCPRCYGARRLPVYPGWSIRKALQAIRRILTKGR